MKRTRAPARYHHGDLRRALIDAALVVLDAEGEEALTTRTLARRLGVSHSAPGHHFHDRQALLAAVAAAAFGGLSDELEAAAQDTPAPAERLVVVGQTYVRFAMRHPARFRLMFGAVAVEASLLEERGRALRVLQAAVHAAAGAGSTPVDELVFTAWSLVHGLATLWLDGPARLFYQAPEAFEAKVARVLGGAVARFATHQ